MKILNEINNLEEEFIVSKQDFVDFKNIINIKRSYEFETLNLSEERLDELLDLLDKHEEQEEILKDIVRDLGLVSSSIIENNSCDYI